MKSNKYSAHISSGHRAAITQFWGSQSAIAAHGQPSFLLSLASSSASPPYCFRFFILGHNSSCFRPGIRYLELLQSQLQGKSCRIGGCRWEPAMCPWPVLPVSSPNASTHNDINKPNSAVMACTLALRAC